MLSFGPEIWLFDGPPVYGPAGFHFPTRMAVVRLPEGHGLWIWSPVALTEDLRRNVDGLGNVTHIVAPNALHHTFLSEWATAYPAACVHAAPGLTEKVAGTSLHRTLGDDTETAWAGALDQVVVRGNRITTEVVFFHRPSATVLVTDLVQQIPTGWYRGWRAVIARLDLMTAPVPSVPRKFRLATTNREVARLGIRRILDWPCDRLVMAHGTPLQSEGKAALQRAFGWLL